jgi:trimeric autotransporter adhesin
MVLGTDGSFYTSAKFTVVSDKYLTAKVPTGAAIGPVTVTTSATTLTSTAFLVTPKVRSFSPTSGPVGTPVVITGNSFTGATRVTFGGVKATNVEINSDTEITANVPTGAKTGKISVTTAGGTGTSSAVFHGYTVVADQKFWNR